MLRLSRSQSSRHLFSTVLVPLKIEPFAGIVLENLLRLAVDIAAKAKETSRITLNVIRQALDGIGDIENDSDFVVPDKLVKIVLDDNGSRLGQSDSD